MLAANILIFLYMYQEKICKFGIWLEQIAVGGLETFLYYLYNTTADSLF